MPAGSDNFSLETATRRWHALAERRLADYAELYRSGRWRHYYRDREAFAARMLDVIKVARAFRRLTGTAAGTQGGGDLRSAA